MLSSRQTKVLDKTSQGAFLLRLSYFVPMKISDWEKIRQVPFRGGGEGGGEEEEKKEKEEKKKKEGK